MKSRQLIGAVIALSAIATVGSALAEHPYPVDGSVAVSTKTRAEVRAELEQARSDGLLMHSGERSFIYEWARPGWIRPDVGVMGVAGSRYSGRSREEVKTELEQARAGGTLMNSGERVYIYEWARPEWIRSNK